MGWIVRANSDLRCDVHRNSMVWVSSTCTDELSSTNLGGTPAVASQLRRFPWTGSSDWRPRLSHGIAPQFHRNAMPPAVESRRDGRLEVRDSAAATGDRNSFPTRMNTGEHGLGSAKFHLSRKTHSVCHGRAPTPLRHRRGSQQRPHARSWAAQIVVNRNLRDTCGVAQQMAGPVFTPPTIQKPSRYGRNR